MPAPERQGWYARGRHCEWACWARHRLERVREAAAAGRDKVVLDIVARPHDLGSLETADRAHDLALHLRVEGARDAVGVDGGGVEPLWLEPHHVLVPRGEALDLDVERRAVARPRAGAAARVVRGEPVPVACDDGVRGRVGRAAVAVDQPRRAPQRRLRRLPVLPVLLVLKGEGVAGAVLGGLHHEGGVLPGDGAAVEPRRRAGLEPCERQPQPLEGERQSGGRCLNLVRRAIAHVPATQRSRLRPWTKATGAGARAQAQAQAQAQACLPAGRLWRPMCTRPRKKVPVVITTAGARSTPSPARRTPPTAPSATMRSSTEASSTSRFVQPRSSRCTAALYSSRSAWARGPRTAGPLEPLSMRKWMPAWSAQRPMRPPRASTSRTRWPLPTPPIDGLHAISPTVSARWVTRIVRAPSRAAAAAASQPACPPPTTITSASAVVLE